MYKEIKDPLRLYRGKDCLEKFCDYIRQEANRLYHMFPEKPMDPLTPKQWKKYNKASGCHIFYKQFGDPIKGPKVRDHCHYTGHYIRAPNGPRYVVNVRERISRRDYPSGP